MEIKRLKRDEARRIAANIVKLPGLLGQASVLTARADSAVAANANTQSANGPWDLKKPGTPEIFLFTFSQLQIWGQTMETSMPTIVAHHEVKDTKHWLASPQRDSWTAWHNKHSHGRSRHGPAERLYADQGSRRCDGA
jgi:hypothetical protein